MGSETQVKVTSTTRGSARVIGLWGWALTLLEEPADGDAALVFEARTRSGGVVPPHTEDNHESFYVLEGVFEIGWTARRVAVRWGTTSPSPPACCTPCATPARAGAGC